MTSVVEEVRKLTSFPWRSWGKKRGKKSLKMNGWNMSKNGGLVEDHFPFQMGDGCR